MPCFALLFYCVTFMRKIQDPELLLFVIAVAPTILTCLKIITKRRGRYVISAPIFAIVSLIIAKGVISSGFLDVVTDRIKLIYISVFVQYFALSVSVLTSGESYHKYTHPQAALLGIEGCHDSLRGLYSALSNIAMTIWHHWDIIVVLGTLLSAKFATLYIAKCALIGGCVLSIVFTLFATKLILQLRMMDLLLPCLSATDKEKYEARKLVKPIGAIAFGMIAAPSVQALFLVGYLYCQTFQSEFSAFYSDLLLILMFTGALLSCFMRVASLF